MHLDIRNLMLGVTSCCAVGLAASLAAAQTTPAPSPASQNSEVVQTVGQIDPSKPIDVVVTNSISTTLSIGFAGGANVKIDPTEEAEVSFTSVPINLFIYPFQQDISTKYNTTIDGNTINIEVVPMNSVTPGDGALNVDRSGVVYIY